MKNKTVPHKTPHRDAARRAVGKAIGKPVGERTTHAGPDWMAERLDADAPDDAGVAIDTGNPLRGRALESKRGQQ